MAIAQTLAQYLTSRGAHYDVSRHPRSHSSRETAALAHIPDDRLAKAVILEDDRGYVAAVLPANCQVRLGHLKTSLHRDLRLADEDEIAHLFRDCAPGAVPPLAGAYGILETVIDETLAAALDVYFEGGDHEALVHMNGREFIALMPQAKHARFARHV